MVIVKFFVVKGYFILMMVGSVGGWFFCWWWIMGDFKKFFCIKLLGDVFKILDKNNFWDIEIDFFFGYLYIYYFL